ncbi:GNAT family N-acetyltransferase [Echinicola soli]|uniref:GNAT family N-acetyltransferase n=1 Tax=Echinicola soli TaxID=2591634 RepID=A0A514CJL9_9BACT|nr:GNAT family N-acetyltransferase [Echinicola soli]QDH80015.1 GNAT family N-acetyltransferase [Echinicola soli]
MEKVDVALISIQFGAEKMDVTAIHHYLSEESYWARGISLEKVKMSIENAFCAGAFYQEKQVGFVRAVTDYATFAWISDVYILEEFAGAGIGKKMLSEFFAQEWFGELRRIMLATKDAHSLYEQFNFTELDKPEMIMQVLNDKFVLL